MPSASRERSQFLGGRAEEDKAEKDTSVGTELERPNMGSRPVSVVLRGSAWSSSPTMAFALCKDPVIVERRIAPRQYICNGRCRVLDGGDEATLLVPVNEPPDLAVNGEAGCGMISDARSGTTHSSNLGSVEGLPDMRETCAKRYGIGYSGLPACREYYPKLAQPLCQTHYQNGPKERLPEILEPQCADAKVDRWRFRMYMATAVWTSPLPVGLPILQPSRKAKREQIMCHDVGRSRCTPRIRRHLALPPAAPMLTALESEVSEVIRDAFTAFHTSDMLRKPEAGEVITLPVPLFAVLNCSSGFWVLIAFGKSSVVHVTCLKNWDSKGIVQRRNLQGNKTEGKTTNLMIQISHSDGMR
ncbi:hypothetical protein L210DRAFT_3631228 [Boletus edulis BED1]|uniref:Uncharacterized protein n=1 Tax=Boletus edulis BED1 TaxID=1328754 RepID=A0AAD4BSQ9_BOLED|nr:hypothetical protein L210DRAFT_3631228 [Boletus edulis BED1]